MAPTDPGFVPARDVVLPQLMADLRARLSRLAEGELAEQRHQVYDLDPDSRFPVPPVMRPEVAS